MFPLTRPLTLGCLIVAGAFSLAAAPPASNCGELSKLQIENTSISEAVQVQAGTPLSIGNGFGPAVVLRSLPEHCLVHGEVNHHKGTNGKEYGDRFEIRMPAVWKGRLLFQGGGGLDGVLNPALALRGAETTADSKSALEFGYAVVSTDGGHQDPHPVTPDGSFGSDAEARADYNYRSTKLVTDVARKIIGQYYRRPIEHSYFRGCSNGGREGLMAAERYPEYFDGVVAGAPAFNLTHAALAEAWNTDQLAAIAPKGEDGKPDLRRSLSEGDLKLVVQKVLEQCDGLDGLKDGMVFNQQACHFDPAVLRCKGAQSPACLPTEKVEAIRKVFNGPYNSKGEALYSPWPFDTGIAAEGWRAWITGAGQIPAINVLIFPSFFNGLALAGKPPLIDIFKFNFDQDPPRIDKASGEINATQTDWSGFRSRGKKLLLYTGVSDPVFSALDLVRYYKQIEQENGGEEQAHRFARLFLVPGMTHCGGGPSVDDFDALDAMQKWVEEGKAPDSMVASGRAFPGRTRPLCAYPLIAKYDGKGNPEDAQSFSCRMP